MSDNEFAQSLSDIMTSQILSIKILRGTTHFMQSEADPNCEAHAKGQTRIGQIKVSKGH